ncbi:MAG: ATP-binding cassette domain-containing protein [Caulobacteraceae bacterium]
MSIHPIDAAETAAAEPIVSFDGVSMKYGRESEILKDVSFGIERGSFHFLTGASGSGKTTLLKMIYLAEKASGGQVTLFGRDVANLAPKEKPHMRRRLGVVYQEFRLLEHLSAFDNVALPQRIMGHKPAKYRADIAELMNWVGLGARMSAMPAALSGGEKQRLAIARAVVHRPDILLADEPTGNVDPAMAMRLLRLFLELNRVGMTVLIASHDEDMVARSGMPVLHLEDGRIRYFGGAR